ncbi:putative mitochondrial cryptochrome DASH precursor [Triangularia verruculosa]|uniref:Mitochondrial cryptochrome DASH n=1 Tax=Triangularia verruculosa TaxID=2587418 RepID=A0AAN6XL63_9PEZI|nr:putative mitochondrial cryptochrome DASH precursor [Triangularia verruculosa]
MLVLGLHRTTSKLTLKSARSRLRVAMTDTKVPQNILIHILRRDLRASDNPLLHAAATAPDGEKFDAHLPLYVIDASQMDVSGFVKDKDTANPYKPTRSQVAGYPRCGPYRAKFVGEAVWDLSESLKRLGSGLFVRLGNLPEVVESLARGLAEKGAKVGAIWMTSHEGSEEKADEKAVASLCDNIGAEWKLWVDEKYFIDDRDIGLESINQLPDVFTTYRKMQEPLRAKPRPVLPPIEKGFLPPLVDKALVPEQPTPFTIPDTLDGLVDALASPVKDFLPNKPDFPEGTQSAHPYKGGEAGAHERLNHFILSGAASSYKATRNGLLGTEFSTKLSAFLAQGCITARQVHATLDAFERGTDARFKDVKGFGAYKDKEDATEVAEGDKSEGKAKSSKENEGIEAIRFELLWRDYMRLCHQKYRNKFFRLSGFQKDYKEEDAGDGSGSGSGSGSEGKPPKKHEWKSPVKERALPDQVPSAEGVAETLERFKAGTTGMGLIDASQRELLHTGYTSNRARQNVASFLAKHLKIDWRYGAEWYEMLLVDYDVSSNWANWQYVSGVGNDPRGEIRIFNPIKQAFEYDKEGSYVRAWVPEVSKLKKLENVFQPCTASKEDLMEAGLVGNVMVTEPVLRINYYVDAKPRTNKRGGFRRGSRRVGGGRHMTHGHGNGNDGKTNHANGNGSGNGNGNVNGNGQTHDARMDAPVVNGTTRGPGNRVAHHRGSFVGSRSPGGGRGGYFNGGGRHYNGNGNGNGNGNNFHNNNTNGGGAHSPGPNGGGPKYRGGGPRYPFARGGGGGGSFHRGGHNGSHNRDNGSSSGSSPPPDGPI